MLLRNLKRNRSEPRQIRRKKGVVMRYAVLVFLCFGCAALGQEQKHILTVAVNGKFPTTLTALDIERVGQYPSAVHLKGAVEIKSPVCLPFGKRG